jgi:hypothetical protein
MCWRMTTALHPETLATGTLSVNATVPDDGTSRRRPRRRQAIRQRNSAVRTRRRCPQRSPAPPGRDATRPPAQSQPGFVRLGLPDGLSGTPSNLALTAWMLGLPREDFCAKPQLAATTPRCPDRLRKISVSPLVCRDAGGTTQAQDVRHVACFQQLVEVNFTSH